MSTCFVKGYSPLALPMGELSPQVTEREMLVALSGLAVPGHLSQRERQGRVCDIQNGAWMRELYMIDKLEFEGMKNPSVTATPYHLPC